jgi:hypothetical protein
LQFFDTFHTVSCSDFGPDPVWQPLPLQLDKQGRTHDFTPYDFQPAHGPAEHIGNSFADPLCLNMARWLETEWCGFVPPPHLA